MNLRLTTLLITTLLFAFAVAARADDQGSDKARAKELAAAFQSAKEQHATDLSHLTAEAARVKYVTALTEIAYSYMGLGRGSEWEDNCRKGWDALNAEIVRYPAPKDSDSKAFSKLRTGKWQSPRHDYLYRKDGTCIMLPAEEGGTRGHWAFKGNQYTEDTGTYTVILLDADYFVFCGDKTVFFETRTGK